METRDAVALAHAWACAAPGDDAEGLGDALSLAVLGGLDTAAAGDVCACAAVRLRALDAPADDDDGDGGCAAVARALALRAPAPRARGARRARRGARRGARAAAAGSARGRGGRGAALRGAARRAPAGAVGRPRPSRRAGRLLASPREPARRLAALFATVDGLSATPRRPRPTSPRRRSVGDASFWRRDWERNARVVAAAGSAATLRASTAAPARGAWRAPAARGGRAGAAAAAAPPGPSLATVRDADPGRDACDCAFDVLRRPAPVAEGADYVRASCADGGLGSGMAASVVVLGADARFRCAAEARRAVQRVLRVGCSVNLYATPPGAQALDAHYDDHCVFVVQLRGRKRWRLYGPALECPTLHEATLPPPPELLRRGADHAVTLSPGDASYVPRGVYHAATACEDAGSDSAHVTVGVDLDPALTWRGAFHARRGRRDATRACAAPPKRRRRCARVPARAHGRRAGPDGRGRQIRRRRRAPGLRLAVVDGSALADDVASLAGLAVPRGAIAVGAADFADAARAVEGAVVDAAVLRGAVARRPLRVRGAVRVLARRRGVTPLVLGVSVRSVLAGRGERTRSLVFGGAGFCGALAAAAASARAALSRFAR
ncbi:histone demethylase [Aureococcus anophagefferens]|nr:histone demethylase [Aureococcus anophagefferens]